MRYKVYLLVLLLLIGPIFSSQSTLFSSNCGGENQYEEFLDEDVSYPTQGWSEKLGLTFNNSDSENLFAVDGPQGNIHMVWQDHRDNVSDIYYVKINALNGEKLINDLRISNSKNDSLNPKITVGDSNQIFVIWEEKATNSWTLFISELKYDAENITRVNDRVVVSSLNCTYPPDYNILKGDGSKVHIVWEGYGSGVQNIFYKSLSTIDFSTSGNKRVTSTQGNSSDPKIITSDDGNLHLFWKDKENKNHGLYYKKFDEDMKQTISRKRLTIIGNSYTCFDVEIDNYGDIHLVFDDNRYHDHKRDIIYTKLDQDGITLIDDRLVTSRGDDSDSFSPDLGINDLDEMYITWSDSRDHVLNNSEDDKNLTDVPHDIYIVRYDLGFKALGPRERLTQSKSFSDEQEIITDSNNDIHLLWKDDEDVYSNINYKMKRKSDIILQKSITQPARPILNENFTISVLVENTGDYGVNTTLQIFKGNKSELEIWDDFNVSIPKKSTKQVLINNTASTKGEREIQILVNPERKLEERWYHNNKLTLNYFVEYPSIHVEPCNMTKSVDPGSVAKFTYLLNNTGNVPQNLSISIVGEEKLNFLNSSKQYLGINQQKILNFSMTIPKDAISGGYRLNMITRSLEYNMTYGNISFDFVVNPIYRFDIQLGSAHIDSADKINYSTNFIVENTGNTKQRISAYVVNGSQYAFIEHGEFILDPNESKQLTLNLSGYKYIEGDELNITILIKSLDSDFNRTGSISIIGKDVETEDKTSFFDKIPWLWILIVIGLIVVAYFILLKIKS